MCIYVHLFTASAASINDIYGTEWRSLVLFILNTNLLQVLCCMHQRDLLNTKRLII